MLSFKNYLPILIFLIIPFSLWGQKTHQELPVCKNQNTFYADPSRVFDQCPLEEKALIIIKEETNTSIQSLINFRNRHQFSLRNLRFLTSFARLALRSKGLNHLNQASAILGLISLGSDIIIDFEEYYETKPHENSIAFAKGYYEILVLSQSSEQESFYYTRLVATYFDYYLDANIGLNSQNSDSNFWLQPGLLLSFGSNLGTAACLFLKKHNNIQGYNAYDKTAAALTALAGTEFFMYIIYAKPKPNRCPEVWPMNLTYLLSQSLKVIAIANWGLSTTAVSLAFLFDLSAEFLVRDLYCYCNYNHE